MNKEWYLKSFRRDLVDMHINDHSEEFLSEFSPEKYCENLKRAHIKSAMIYLQSHIGLCYYPTKTGIIHNAFKEDPSKMRRLVELCHENGIDVIGYYSLIYNTREEERHPDWRVLETETQSRHELGARYGHCCPCNREYVDFVKAQIKEMCEYFPVDGMFYDMTFWSSLCKCPSCRRRWTEETGYGIMPEKPDWNDGVWRLYYKKRCEWMGEFAREITAYTKELLPDVSVEHNYANSVAGGWDLCSTELVNDACDYCGGDLYGSIENHSFAVKYFSAISKNGPCEYMIGRCDPDLKQHTVTKSVARLEKEVLLNAAHHAATLVIDAIDPRGTMDERVYGRIGGVFERQMPYERYFTGTPVYDVAVLYNTVGRYVGCGERYDHKTCAVNAVRALTEEHVPVGVIPSRSSAIDARLKCIVVPYTDGMDTLDGETTKRLAQYAEMGGTVYFSGNNKELLKELLGAECVGKTESVYTYVAPTKENEGYFLEFNEAYPLPFECSLPIVSLPRDTEVQAYIKLPYTLPTERRFASIHSNPPGVLTEHPALVMKRYGKGRVIWSAAPIEGDGRYIYRRIFSQLLSWLVPKEELTVRAEISSKTEIVSFVGEDDMTLSAVDLSYDEERRISAGGKITCRVPREPSAVQLLPGNENVPFSYVDGRVGFSVEPFDLFAMYRISFGQ